MAANLARKKPLDEVDRAVEGIDRAIQRVIKLMGDEDDSVGQKALDALLRRLHPTAAVAYLAQELGRSAGDTRLRRRVATALAAIGQRARGPATATLCRCVLKEEDQAFAGHLLTCLGSLGPHPGQTG